MTMRRVKLLCTALMLLASHGALAVSYPLPPEGSRLVGSAFTIAVPDNNTQPLESFAALCAALPQGRILQPDRKNHEFYQEHYPIFRDLYLENRDRMHRMQK